jgi:GNAT superfamily N-acetyltransferase
MAEIIIRTAEAKDFGAWKRLWFDYLDFYRAKVTDEVAARTWARIMEPAGAIGSLIADADGTPCGICNYLFHDTCWAIEPTCYLQDLFVDPKTRGSGASRQLILACEEMAKKRGAGRLYWLTQEYNAPARSLYDTLAQRTSFIVYRKAL